MTTCYADESGTDSNLPIAVVASVVLDDPGSFWLDVEWTKVREKHGIDGAIHMREFTPDGLFKSLTHAERRALFADLVKVIRTNKLVTLAATLTAEQYRRHFTGLTKLSMYGACFANLMTLVGEAMRIYGSHRWPLCYVLDGGNQYRKHIKEGLPFFLRAYPQVAGIAFESDDNFSALQAADVLSWAVRRQLSGANFGHGFEPIQELFDEQHLDFEYKEEWMQGVAETIRAAESSPVDSSASKPESLTNPQG